MTQPALTQPPFSIVVPQGFYTVNGVLLPTGKYGSVEITTQPLDGGRSRTPDGWADYRQLTGWGPGSGPLHMALFKGLYEHQEDEGVKKLKRLFAADLRNWMVTSTRVTYQTEGLDIVTHDDGMPEEITLEARLVGPSGYINAGMSDALQALLGEGNADKLSAIHNWVTDRTRTPRLARFSGRPRKNTEIVLALAFNFIIDLGIFAAGTIYKPARGMRVVPYNPA